MERVIKATIINLFSLCSFWKRCWDIFFSILKVVVNFRVRFLLNELIFSTSLDFFFCFTNRVVISDIFEKKSNRKAFIVI